MRWPPGPVFDHRTQLSLKTITKVLHAATSVDKQTLEAFFCAFNLILEPSDYCFPSAGAPTSQTVSPLQLKHLDPPIPSTAISPHWGEAPDVSGFYGRDDELAQLYQWKF
ncbi:MAG: hypothetical protein ACFE0I_11810 [Elainellaceae cyanobacterium]